MFNGLGLNLGNLSMISNAETRSISPENFTGEKGEAAMAAEGTGKNCARELGVGWKVSPSVRIRAGETFTVADIKGPGAIQQIWMTPTGNWRYTILRIYWDGQEQPSVEVPLGDFFCCGWGTDDGRNHKGANFRQLTSLPICVNPGSAFNSYWEMPFRKHCRVTVTNIQDVDKADLDKNHMGLYYQVNYTLTDVPEDCAYFHAQWRRANPLPYKEEHTLVDGVKGQGHYVGTYMAWGVNNNGWWGEGEIKFFMDGDKKFPTICGTGTEDYFCGSYNFDVGKENGGYREFCSPYAGLFQVLRPDGLYQSQTRFSLYRWHIMDPVRFKKDLKVTIQALGWRSGGRYLPLQDDIASTVFWYQTLPTAPFPQLPDRDYLEVI
ncbi:MAG: glycoside hydrolase family 172 protein [Lentisphaerota bacterium]